MRYVNEIIENMPDDTILDLLSSDGFEPASSESFHALARAIRLAASQDTLVWTDTCVTASSPRIHTLHQKVFLGS